ncbi:MAG: two-component system, sporulation sensor kinase D [Glaciecola sp.]|jgi:two-component system, sporulation sensor kinase D
MLTKNQNIIRWTIVLSSFIIISLILWNTYDFFQKFKYEERAKMQTWSFAQSDFLEGMDDLEADVSGLTTQVMETNTTTPMILVDDEGKIFNIRNIDTTNIRNPETYLEKLKTHFEKENKPIEVRYKDTIFGTIVYGNSELLNKLKYYPLALVLIIILFAAVAYFFYRSTKVATQNKLWTGMAKETAHQIGTPLSSLIGWTEILRSENVNPDYIKEIEKDVDRLQTITDRFSKIGSVPKLDKVDIVFATQDSYDYLKRRSSDLIEFEFDAPSYPLFVNLNMQLYSWTIENLVKNAIDAMKGKGQLKITLTNSDKEVFIQVTDTGKGIPKTRYKKIFNPGFTSKKRGWGLGLSLSKRIIEDYHQGRIKVLHSELKKGSTIQISLKLIA